MHLLHCLFLLCILILTGCAKTVITSQESSTKSGLLKESMLLRSEEAKMEPKSRSEDLTEVSRYTSEATIQLLAQLSWTPYARDQSEATLQRVAQHGDDAIPYLEEFIDQEANIDSRDAYRYMPQAFNVLGKIHTDKSTELIKKYYGMSSTRAHAATALSYKPYRPKAKDEYIDILKGKEGKFQRYYAAEACVEYNWKDALPCIKMICEKPFSWHDFCTAYRAKKTLDDDPISDEMIKAYNDIRRYFGPEDLEKAKKIILQLPDKESAAVFAIDLLFMGGYKMRTQRIDAFHNTAWDILRALPRDTTKPLIGRLLNSIDSGSKRTFPELKLFYESH